MRSQVDNSAQVHHMPIVSESKRFTSWCRRLRIRSKLLIASFLKGYKEPNRRDDDSWDDSLA